MKGKTLRKALFTSIISLVMCFSMLVGTTFAWFTDSVSSKNNIIVAGNLDIELYYLSDEVTDWTKVDANTNVFKNTLWEPGHTEVVKLKVVNEGSLALKYKLSVSIFSEVKSVNKEGADFLLSDFIKYGIVDGTIVDEGVTLTRDQAIEAVDATAKALKVANNLDEVQLIAGAEKVVTMVVYMPTSVDDEANPAKGAPVPTINLGIDLIATQLNSELDSFDKDYDKESAYPTIVDVNGAVIEADDFGMTIDIPKDALKDGITSVTPIISVKNAEGTNNVPTDANTNLTKTFEFDISIPGIKPDNTIPVGVTYVLPDTVTDDFDSVKVFHNDQEVAGATYDKENRTVYFETISFSPYTFVFDTGAKVIPESYTNDEAVAMLNALKDGAIIDGLGREITFADNVANKWSFLIQNSVTLKNMTLKAKGDGSTVMIYGKNKTIKLENVTFQNTKFGKKAVELSTNARESLVFENCTIKGKAYVQGTNVTFDNCSFNTNNNLESATNITFKNCKFTVSSAVTMNSSLKNILFENNTFSGVPFRLYDNMPQPTNVQIINNTYKTNMATVGSNVDYEGWKTAGAWIEEGNEKI